MSTLRSFTGSEGFSVDDIDVEVEDVFPLFLSAFEILIPGIEFLEMLFFVEVSLSSGCESRGTFSKELVDKVDCLDADFEDAECFFPAFCDAVIELEMVLTDNEFLGYVISGVDFFVMLDLDDDVDDVSMSFFGFFFGLLRTTTALVKFFHSLVGDLDFFFFSLFSLETLSSEFRLSFFLNGLPSFSVPNLGSVRFFADFSVELDEVETCDSDIGDFDSFDGLIEVEDEELWDESSFLT